MDPKILREAALAYQAVYDEELRQEIEEQQDFENWVNSLVEEGYDLSEFTWEEMYEEYLSEAPNLGTGGTAQDMINRRQATLRRTGGTLGAGGGQAAMRNLQSRGVDPRSAYARVYAQGERNLAASSRPSSARPTPAPSAASRPSGGSRPAPAPAAARPSGGSSAPAARPAASAPTAKPAPSAGQTGDKTKDMQTWAKANPSLAAKVKPGQSGYGAVQQARAATGGDAAAKSAGKLNTSAVTKTAFSSSTPALSKPLSTPSTSSTATPAAKPTPTTQKRTMGSTKPGSIVSSFDMFDLVKGYLIDEGYADTEDAAISIMASMSENWKTAIIAEARAEGVKAYRPNPTQAEVRADERRARKKHVEKSKGQKGYGDEEKFKSDWKLKVTPGSKLKRKGGDDETVSQRMDREHPYKTRMTGPMAREYGSRHAAEVTRVVKGAGEPQAVTYPRKVRKEELELYNYILSHLLDEGYASDVETAEGIIENMSDEWILSILG